MVRKEGSSGPGESPGAELSPESGLTGIITPCPAAPARGTAWDVERALRTEPFLLLGFRLRVWNAGLS